MLWSACFRSTFCLVTSFGLVPQQIRGVHLVPCEILRKSSPGTALYLKNERHKNSRKLSIAFISFVLWSACFRSTFCLVTSFGLVPQQIQGVHLVPCENLRKSSPGTALYLKNERHKNTRKLSIAYISFELWSACFRSTFCLVNSFGLVPQQIRWVHLVPCEILLKEPHVHLFI